MGLMIQQGMLVLHGNALERDGQAIVAGRPAQANPLWPMH